MNFCKNIILGLFFGVVSICNIGKRYIAATDICIHSRMKDNASFFMIKKNRSFFSDNEQPLFIMMEFGAVKEDTVWKISYIDFKGAEYADSALTD